MKYAKNFNDNLDNKVIESSSSEDEKFDDLVEEESHFDKAKTQPHGHNKKNAQDRANEITKEKMEEAVDDTVFIDNLPIKENEILQEILRVD